MQCWHYEIGRYWVESESGNEPYLVDVLVGGEGCDCPDNGVRVKARKEKTACKHIAKALEQWRRDFSPAEREQIIKQQKRVRPPFAPPSYE